MERSNGARATLAGTRTWLLGDSAGTGETGVSKDRPLELNEMAAYATPETPHFATDSPPIHH